MTKEQLKRRLIDIRNGAMITPLLEELTIILEKARKYDGLNKRSIRATERNA
jgi:hypothetical protein